MAKPQHGFIVITDIPGTTGYLSHSELEHGQTTPRLKAARPQNQPVVRSVLMIMSNER